MASTEKDESKASVKNEPNEASKDSQKQTEIQENAKDRVQNQVQDLEEPNDQFQVLAQPQDSPHQELQTSRKQKRNVLNVTLEQGLVYTDSKSDNIVVNNTSVVLQDVITLLAKGLKNTYNKMAYSLHLPWSGGSVDLNDYFSKILIESKLVVDTKKKQKLPRTKLHQLFGHTRKKQKPTRIIFHEDDTTMSAAMVMHICRTWAKSEEPTALGVFDLVIAVDGKQLADRSLDELIVQTCYADGLKDEEILEIVKANRNTLLILNDLPPRAEISTDLRKPLQLLLNNGKYQLANVLVISHRTAFNFPWKNGVTDIDSCYVISSGSATCTKFARIGVFSRNSLPDAFLPPNMQTGDVMATLREYLKGGDSTGELGRLAYLFLLVHVFVDSRKLQIDHVGTKVFMAVFDQLKTKHLGNGTTSSTDSLSSRLGEYILSVFVSQDPLLTYEGMKKHFGSELATVLKFGFSVVILHHDNETYTEKLVTPPKSLLEVMIAYYVWTVYKTRSTEQFLGTLDVLNEFEPLNLGGCLFTCESLVMFLGFDAARQVRAILQNKRSRYKRFLSVLVKAKELNKCDDGASSEDD